MAIITWLKRISATLLVMVVAAGAYLFDARFTILLMPPFLFYYATETPGFFEALPVVGLVQKVYTNMTTSFGELPINIGLGLLGGVLGLGITGGWATVDFVKNATMTKLAPYISGG